MRNQYIITIVLVFCFVVSYAQCDDLLQSAQMYKNQGEYGKAVERYDRLEKQCPKYFNETIRGERNFCQQKMNKKPLVNHSASEESTKFGLVVSDTQLFFEAEGGTDSHISVTCEADYWLSNSGDDWLETEAIGGVLVVKCKPNPDPWKREGHVDILCGGGMSGVSNISVEQEARREEKSIRALVETLTVTKILFDFGKDIPKIQDPNGNLDRTVEILRANPKLALEVEGYTCDIGSEEYNRDLAQRRANKVRDLFIQKGVNPSQIMTSSYTINDPQNNQNIPDPRREEHDAAIFRIVKR